MSVPNPATTDWVPLYAGGALTYEGDHVPAGLYQDGDIVVKDGIAYLCVGGPTTDPPSIAPWGQAGLSVVGDELGYAEMATDQAVGTIAQASAITMVTLPPLTFDGATPVILDFHIPWIAPGATNHFATFNLWDGTTDLGVVSQIQGINLFHTGKRRLVPSAGAHTFSLRGWSSNGSFTVMNVGRLPTFLRATRVTPSPPSFGAGALTPVTYGITLPASPTDGQEAILVDSLTAPTYSWRFRFTASVTDSYRWVFIGGSPVMVRVGTQETCTSLTYVDLATVGPTFTAPRAGIYETTFGSRMYEATGPADTAVNVFYNGVAGPAQIFHGTGGREIYVSRGYQGTLTGASQVIKMMYARVAGSGASGYSERWMQVTPVRVA